MSRMEIEAIDEAIAHDREKAPWSDMIVSPELPGPIRPSRTPCLTGTIDTEGNKLPPLRDCSWPTWRAAIPRTGFRVRM
jgi:hypothetical protein